MVATDVEIMDISRSVVSQLEPKMHVSKIILFGSYASGAPKKWSDIDIAIISPSFSRLSIWRRQELLAESLPKADVRLPLSVIPQRNWRTQLPSCARSSVLAASSTKRLADSSACPLTPLLLSEFFTSLVSTMIKRPTISRRSKSIAHDGTATSSPRLHRAPALVPTLEFALYLLEDRGSHGLPVPAIPLFGHLLKMAVEQLGRLPVHQAASVPGSGRAA